MKYFILLATLFSLTSAQAAFEVYGGLELGSATMNETLAGSDYTHRNTFFVGHFGYGLGFRWKYDLGGFAIGPVADIFWNGDSFDRKQIGVINDMTYRYESYRLLGGLATSFKLGALSLLAEYYPWVQNTVTYSDDKTENPYRKNDKLKATGFGFGFSYELITSFHYTVLFRRLTYKDVTMNGTAVLLPTDQYTTLTFDNVFFGGTKTF